MKIVIIDGQGGRMGALLCDRIMKKRTSLSAEYPNTSSGTEARTEPAAQPAAAPSFEKGTPADWVLYAIGTNSIATAAMLKAGADYGATGENPVLTACRDADYIIGPLGILAADSLLGEVTPAMAVAVGQSRAQKILLPINRCNHHVVGVQEASITALADQAVDYLCSCLLAGQ